MPATRLGMPATPAAPTAPSMLGGSGLEQADKTTKINAAFGADADRTRLALTMVFLQH
jgi:hypothetical protein